MRTRLLEKWVGCALLCAATLAPAQALSWDLRLEGGAAFPLTDVLKSTRNIGIGGGLKAGAPFLDMGDVYLDLELSLDGIWLKEKNTGDESFAVLAAGGGPRLRYRADSGASPWLDLNALYADTKFTSQWSGRFAWSAGLGVSLPLSSNRSVWLGPYVRLLHVSSPGENIIWHGGDPLVLIAGLQLEVGSPQAQPQPAAEAAPPAPEPEAQPEPAPEPAPEAATEAAPEAKPEAEAAPAAEPAPEPAPAVKLTGDSIELRDMVLFKAGKAIIDPQSFGLLDQVADLMNQHTELTKVEVQGHTDRMGKAAKNKRLSQKRAEAVRTYLIKKGVAAKRLRAHGYGQAKLICQERTSECDAKNRRVEFVIMK